MASVSTYLNFKNETEPAFEFYRSVFGGEFLGGISRYGDMPPDDNMPPLPGEEKDLVLHVCLPILGGHRLMGSDCPASMGFHISAGNNFNISLNTDTREQADTLMAALSEGGKVTMPMADMFWGAYYGACTDKFGINWMINFETRNPYQ
jgi:PhnB protein